MKKFMMAAVALICMTMMSVSLTACGGDDDSSKPKEQIHPNRNNRLSIW